MRNEDNAEFRIMNYSIGNYKTIIDIMRVRGTLYGVTYRQTKDGMVMQEKPRPSSEQVKNDPEFVETRKMSSEFGKACTGSGY
jgi:hypothetical protein